MRNLILLSATSLALLVGCKEQPPVPPPASPPPGPGGQPNLRPPGFQVPTPPSGSGAGATGMTWTTPATWVSEKPGTTMRKAQYKVPGSAGDAQCIVFYFGPGQGGPARANVERWANQFTQADGSPGAAAMKSATRTVHGMNVMTVEVTGAYSGGFMMGGPKPPPKPGHMLLGAVAEGPDANWFFKLTGPQATVEENRAAFTALVDSLKAGS